MVRQWERHVEKALRYTTTSESTGKCVLELYVAEGVGAYVPAEKKEARESEKGPRRICRRRDALSHNGILAE